MVTQIKNYTHLLKMSIQVNLDGLSFCIVNSEEKEIYFFRKVNFGQQLDPVKILNRIEQEFKQEEALQQEISEVKLVFSNSLYTLVPEKLFKEEQASDYLKFNTKILKTDFIAHDVLKNAEAVCVYIPYTNIINYFFDKYGEFEYTHSITVLVENLLELESKQAPVVFLYNRNKNYDLVIIENGKLIFCNSFAYETPEDFLYYLLFTAEQLNLNPEKFELQLLGEISEESEFYQLTYSYVKNIHLMDQEVSFAGNYSEATGEYVLLNSF